MTDAVSAGRPWYLWVVGLVSLLWNAGGGAMDYTLIKLGNADYLQVSADAIGMDVGVVESYFAAFPIWMNAFSALGVWAAVLGSLLLLYRSRFAFHAFLASFVGIVVSTYYQVANPFPGEVTSNIPAIMSVLVPVITLALAWHARAMTRRGVLR